MENFVNFIVHYIETTKIHGIQGWLNQLQAYQWGTNSGIERYPEGILTSKKFLRDSQKILNIPNNDNIWQRHCDDIRKWGGVIREIPSPLAVEYKKMCEVSFNQ